MSSQRLAGAILSTFFLLVMYTAGCVIQWKTTDSKGISKEGTKGTEISPKFEFLNKKIDTVQRTTREIKEIQRLLEMEMTKYNIRITDSLREAYEKDSAAVVEHLIDVLEGRTEYNPR